MLAETVQRCGCVQRRWMAARHSPKRAGQRLRPRYSGAIASSAVARIPSRARPGLRAIVLRRDREHVRYFQANSDKGIYIGLPTTNKMTGTPTVFFVRPIRDANAVLLGLIVVGVPIAKLQHIYETVGLLDDHGHFVRGRGADAVAREGSIDERRGELNAAAVQTPERRLHAVSTGPRRGDGSQHRGGL